jgi:hypothetical protein
VFQTRVTADGPDHIAIHGQFNKPAPTVFLGKNAEMRLTGSTIDYVHIVHLGSHPTLTLRESNANRVQVDSTATDACVLVSATIYNSTCVSHGGDTAVLVDGNGVSNAATLRNVTAVGMDDSDGVDCHAESGGSCSMLVVNSIVSGTADFDARAEPDGSMATVNTFNSAFKGFTAAGSATVNRDDSDIDGAPVFVDAANGDFREAASSPTIDTGFDDGVEGNTDAAGLPRIMGNAVDIGAFELPVPATISDVQVARVRKHSIRVSAVVDTQGLASSLQLVASHKGSTISAKPQSLWAHNTPTKVSRVGGAHKPPTEKPRRV